MFKNILMAWGWNTTTIISVLPSAYKWEVSGYDIENKSLNELAIRIFDCENNSICISYIEKWLLSQIADNLANTTYRVKRIDAAIQRIYITPQISVTELSSIACLSKKQFVPD